MPGPSESPFGSILKDAAALVALIIFIPAAILVIGTPFALAVAFLLWLGRLAGGAF